ncbi:MAG: 6-carboxytetrahydropterin synthase [Bdellovibrionales bacterium]|nr:6-carboxytetrahydropterin synthase [Bdellovibrionales bacterium]
MPKWFRLTAYHQFRAAHALAGFEIQHFHLWKISVEFEVPYPLSGDRVVDLVFAEQKLEELTKPLHGTLLNESLNLSPTSENLCVWLWSRWSESLPENPLSSVSVTLCDLEGHPWGKAELRR